MSDDEMLTPRQAAKRLNRSAQTLAGWRTHGAGPAFLKYGKGILYSPTVLDDWRRSQTTAVDLAPEPPTKRRKSLVAVSPERVADDADTVDLGLLFGRADVLKGLVILEPVNLNELTVHEALTQFDDIAILKRPDGQMQAYGLAGTARSVQLVEAQPANVLVMISGRIAPLAALAGLMVPPGALDD